ncbi:MAG: MBL fold metallo-hydrolase [Anaerolineales bacterium]|nr:MBL fold metallo-hydrolase [Anaerolineales bacterium]
MGILVRFLGMAAFEIINSKGQVILIDPFLDDNPVSPVRVVDLERVDLVLVTHLAFDHLGDAAAISKHFSCPVVCGPEVRIFLEQQGVDSRLIRKVTWGGQVAPNGIFVRSVECHHTSFRQAPDGQYLSGQPLGFVVYPDPGIGIYHSGDTSLFSDLKLIGELHRPSIGLMCACEPEREFLEANDLLDHRGNELNGEEGALAAIWLGLEIAIICHYLEPDGREDVTKFINILRNTQLGNAPLVQPLALRPGETFEYPLRENHDPS